LPKKGGCAFPATTRVVVEQDVLPSFTGVDAEMLGPPLLPSSTESVVVFIPMNKTCLSTRSRDTCAELLVQLVKRDVHVVVA
jgi:hypothetical protein